MKRQALGSVKKQDEEGSENAKAEEDKKNYKNDYRNQRGGSLTPLPIHYTHLSLHLFDKDVKMRCCQNFECSHHLVTPNK
jgi:hypothetical protein